MKRLWAAAAILAVLLGGTLWNAWYAERLTGGMIQQLKQAPGADRPRGTGRGRRTERAGVPELAGP